MCFPSLRRAPAAAIALLLLGTAGCGPRLYPVRGKVTLGDGKPLTEGMVVFERKGEAKEAVTARGEIEADGSYRLGTHRPGDGAPAGTYRVLVAPKSDPNAVDRPAQPPPFDPRYADFKTSGLEFEVTLGGPNDFPITVSPVTAKKKGR
jgi:hypothetical protein